MMQWLNKKIIKRVFSYSVAMALTQVLMMAYTIILMWWLTPEKYGIIAANYAAIVMMAFIINWGFNEWLVKTIPTSEHPSVLTGSVIRFKIIAGIFWAIGLWVVLPFIQPGIYQRALLAIIILDVWLDTCFNLFIADLLGREKVLLASGLLVFSRVLRLLSILFIVVLSTQSIILILMLRLICTLIVFIAAWIASKPKFGRGIGLNTKEVFRFSFAFNASEMLSLIFSQIDINLLTWLNGDAELIGNYAFVTSLIHMVMTVPLGIYNLLLPGLIKTYQASAQLFNKRMRYVIIGFFALGLFIWGGLSLLGMDWVMIFLGADYQEGVRLLIMASPVLFLRSLNQFNNVYLIAVGWEMKRLLPQAISVIIKIIAGVFIVMRWQAVGLVWLSIGSAAILLSGYCVQTARHYFKGQKIKAV